MKENERILENLKATLCDMIEIIDFETERDKQDVKELDNDVSKIIDLLDELEEYRAIGTIEEFKVLKEKNVAKKPRFYAHNYYCTECGNLVGNNEFEWQRFLYCDKCGQKLDWE